MKNANDMDKCLCVLDGMRDHHNETNQTTFNKKDTTDPEDSIKLISNNILRFKLRDLALLRCSMKYTLI